MVTFPRWTKTTGAIFLVAACACSYQAAALVLVAFGVGNERHFSSSAFQLERTNKLLEVAGREQFDSIAAATSTLLPPGAQTASWSYSAGDESWLCTIAKVRWQDSVGWHEAQWVIRYCADPLWREHFVEAVALNDAAKALTPVLEMRGSIYGAGAALDMRPRDGAFCFVQ